MYFSMVSAIASASSSSEYSWPDYKLNLGDLSSSRLSVLKCLLDDQNSRSDYCESESKARDSREALGTSMDASERHTQMATLESHQRPTRDQGHPDVPGGLAVSSRAVVFRAEMAPTKRITRASPATTTTTTHVTNARLKALIDQGVADALAVCDADRSQNGDDIHNSGTGSRRTE
ncbi:hypothetical protein Tco_1011283 [Tanacetum coccineum]